MRLKSPNPLFEKWLTEWRDKAKETDSNMQYCFAKALASLKKYPLPLENGKSCKILKGFGDKLCIMLDKKLKEYKDNPERFQDNSNADDDITKTSNCYKDNGSSPTKKRKISSAAEGYIPTFRSGPYAILIALYEKDLEGSYEGFLLKKDLIAAAQLNCDTSFTKPNPGSYYTAWSSMATLVTKKLVVKKGNPAQFALTEEGKKLAEQLYLRKISEEEVSYYLIY